MLQAPLMRFTDLRRHTRMPSYYARLAIPPPSITSLMLELICTLQYSIQSKRYMLKTLQVML